MAGDETGVVRSRALLVPRPTCGRTTTGSGSRPTSTGTRSTCSSRRSHSSTPSRRGWRRSARTSAPTPGRAAGRSSGSTGTRASRRTRRRTRQTSGSTSATSGRRTPTRPATTSTSARARSSPAAASGTRDRGGDAHSRGDRRRPGALEARHPQRRLREAARARRRLAQARPAVGRPGAPVRGRPEAEGLLRLGAPERGRRRRSRLRRRVRADLPRGCAADAVPLRRARGAVLVSRRLLSEQTVWDEPAAGRPRSCPDPAADPEMHAPVGAAGPLVAAIDADPGRTLGKAEDRSSFHVRRAAAGCPPPFVVGALYGTWWTRSRRSRSTVSLPAPPKTTSLARTPSRLISRSLPSRR